MKSSHSTVSLLGVPFDPLSLADARQRITALLQDPHNAAVFTPNPEMLWQANKDPSLKALLSGADFLLPGASYPLQCRR